MAAGSTLALVCGMTAFAQNPRDRHNVGPEAFTSRTIAQGLDNPWDIVWGPDDHLWITERTGLRVTRLDPATGSKRVALVLDDVYQSVVQDGLLGIALHPDLLRGREGYTGEPSSVSQSSISGTRIATATSR
jgi:glucose/arabinose dehydrogenase